MAKNTTWVVIPNWNGSDIISACLQSLKKQSFDHRVAVVENGSTDDSVEIIKKGFPDVTLLEFPDNAGFAGGVNRGIRHALQEGAEYIALLNNDAVADKHWLSALVSEAKEYPEAGIVTSKILIGDSGRLDSTGDWYTTTGMPFPRGRDEIDEGQYDSIVEVFGGSGGASLYRAEMLMEIGLFDEDFFAYYEDVDISFRAQLAGWKVRYQPKAIVLHGLSQTSGKMGSYFAIRQSAKNFWYLYIKNLPAKLFWKYLPAALYRYARMFAARLIKGGFWAFFLGWAESLLKSPQKFAERRIIQKKRKVSIAYLESILYKGKPPVPKKTSD